MKQFQSKWETRAYLNVSVANLQARMDEAQEGNWELVSVTQVEAPECFSLFYKRLVREEI